MTGCTAHGQRLSVPPLEEREARGTPYGVRGIPAVWVRVGVVC